MTRTKLAALAALALLLLAGCSEKDVPTFDVEMEDANQGSVTLDTAGGETVLSSVAEIPPSFPEDIPLPEGAVITATLDQKEQGNSMVAFDAEQPFDEAIELYQNYASEAGYAEAIPATIDSQMFWYSGTRGEEQLVITLNKDLERDGWVYGAVTYTSGAPE
ncbi:hypothetical protein [Paenibacillus soyae]|uniref:Lipoprotein n=1 Tax=Paenibacillus soyae TaxID=2969249 RepID=A0A9X2MUN1_9BACL|nr:hypothetical protein [Paenibacillus soyae]MCR2806594.1 hypothetical protein [Paenibacillus soyae]